MIIKYSARSDVSEFVIEALMNDEGGGQRMYEMPVVMPESYAMRKPQPETPNEGPEGAGAGGGTGAPGPGPAGSGGASAPGAAGSGGAFGAGAWWTGGASGAGAGGSGGAGMASGAGSDDPTGDDDTEPGAKRRK